MSETRSTKDLFKAWRGGDVAAGQAMAQRFADWYYAVATSRLGEARGRGPCDVACQRFGQGVVQVTEARALEKWAHGLIQEEVAKGGGVARDGDEPNAYSNNQSPKALLARARTALPAEVGLLETVYGGRATEAEIARLAEPLGGGPIGVLTARYRLKRWLRDHAGAPFAVTPEQPILDRAPLPLYESSQMASESEMVQFEQWMLTDLDLCRDIAEFATFSVALRGGIGKAAPAPAPRPPVTSGGQARPAAASGSRSSSAEPAARGGVSKALIALVVLGILAIVLVTTAVVAVRFLL